MEDPAGKRGGNAGGRTGRNSRVVRILRSRCLQPFHEDAALSCEKWSKGPRRRRKPVGWREKKNPKRSLPERRRAAGKKTPGLTKDLLRSLASIRGAKWPEEGKGRVGDPKGE